MLKPNAINNYGLDYNAFSVQIMQLTVCLSFMSPSMSSGTMGRHPVQHAFHADILVNVGPAHALPVAKDLPMLSLLHGGVG